MSFMRFRKRQFYRNAKCLRIIKMSIGKDTERSCLFDLPTPTLPGFEIAQPDREGVGIYQLNRLQFCWLISASPNPDNYRFRVGADRRRGIASSQNDF